MKATCVWEEEEEELSQRLACGNDSSFFAHSAHCFLLLLPAPVLGTEVKDFPEPWEMERMTGQGKGRMTRIFLYCLFESNSLFLQLVRGVRFLSAFCITGLHHSPVNRLTCLSMEIITLLQDKV